MPKLLVGVDEAGRGCVIGPLFLAAFAITEDDYLIDKLNSLGVRDSKLLLSKKRDELAKEIKKIAHYYKVARISPRLIDGFSINDLEIKFSARLVSELAPAKVYLDVPASGAGIRNYCNSVISLCVNSAPKVIGANKMDSTNVLVAAASILAKSEREKHLKILKKKYGDFGSGYPADPVTINWLKDWRKTQGRWPRIVRKKWTTLQNI